MSASDKDLSVSKESYFEAMNNCKKNCIIGLDNCCKIEFSTWSISQRKLFARRETNTPREKRHYMWTDLWNAMKISTDQLESTADRISLELSIQIYATATSRMSSISVCESCYCLFNSEIGKYLYDCT